MSFTRWLTVEDAAERLGVSKASIRRWAKEGKIASVQTPGGHRRFTVEAVDAALTPEIVTTKAEVAS